MVKVVLVKERKKRLLEEELNVSLESTGQGR